MKVTDEHRERAGRLTMHPLDPMPVPPDRLGTYRRLTLAAPAGYLAAVERIEYHDEDPANVFWVAPHDEAQVVPGYGLMYGPDGEALSSEEAREFAYELLVLADINDRTSPAQDGPTERQKGGSPDA
jgi:hypothetical protein